MAVLAGEAHARAGEQAYRVVVVPGLEAADLRSVSGRGAVGLLVPGAGPEISQGAALAMVERGRVANSLRDPLPSGPVRVRVELATAVPNGDGLIVVGIPAGATQANDRRYGIVVIDARHRGLLTSQDTRIPGLVAIEDIASTALGEEDALGSEPAGDPLGELAELDRRIDDHNEWRSRTARWLEWLTIALAIACAPAGVLAVAALLLTNLLLGALAVAPELSFALLLGAALGGLGLARRVRAPVAIAWLLGAVVLAHLVSFFIDERWLALSPLGPSQNSRFYGVSNLVETLLLVPSLAAVGLLAHRRPLAAAGVAGLALVTIGGSRFGADGGGAIVLAIGFAVMATLSAGGGRRALGVAAGVGLAIVAALVALDAITGVSSHVTAAASDGPRALADHLGDRLSLSWERATSSTTTALRIGAELAVLVALVVRLARLDVPLATRALPLAFAAAIAMSLLVNDSPKDVVFSGLAGFVAVEALALRERSTAGWIRGVARR